MNQFPILNNPPLVETAFCVEMKTAALTEETTIRLAKKIAPEFSAYDRIIENNFTWDMSRPENGPVRNSGWIGGHFKKDANLVVTVRMTPNRENVIFAFSMLAPYTHWNDFNDQALRIFSGLRHELSEAVIVRVGVRSIDRILIPQDVLDLRDMVKTLPVDALQTNIAPPTKSFTYQDQLFNAEHSLYATTIRASQVDAKTGKVNAVILDTDVFFLPNNVLTDEELRNRLNAIRKVKDSIFFGSIGERAMRIFK